MTERKVYPREPMTAEPDWIFYDVTLPHSTCNDELPQTGRFTDDEFAAAFRPAEDLDLLIEAVRRFQQVDEACGEAHGCDVALLDEWDEAMRALWAALRQWEGKE